jgi:hypothetical protein
VKNVQYALKEANMTRFRPPKDERRKVETRTTSSDVQAAINQLSPISKIDANNVYEAAKLAANAAVSLRLGANSDLGLPRLFPTIEALEIELNAIRAGYCTAEQFIRFSNTLQRVAQQTPMKVAPLRQAVSGTVLTLQFAFPLGTGPQITTQIALWDGDTKVQWTEVHESSRMGDSICFAITLPEPYDSRDAFLLRVVSEFRIGHDHSATIQGMWERTHNAPDRYRKPTPPKDKEKIIGFDGSSEKRPQRKPKPEQRKRKNARPG